VVQLLKRLTIRAEDKCVKTKVERRIAAVDCTMMVWTDEHEVPEIVVAAATEPADVVCFTQLVSRLRISTDMSGCSSMAKYLDRCKSPQTR
jgi:hypothetical protein